MSTLDLPSTLDPTTMLDSPAAFAAGLAALADRDPVMARLRAEVPPLAPRRRPAGFEGLAGIVVAQQVSTASAAAIWGRLAARLGAVTPEQLAAVDDAALKGAGLSAAKIRTLRALAAAIREGALPLDALGRRDADSAHRALVAIHGIGPWTADVYLLFCLGHPDAFPAGDLALQEAARLAYGLAERPSAAALTARAEAWRPWRGVAATLLWAYYRVAKAREGAPTP